MTTFKAGLVVPWFRVISEWVVFSIKAQLDILFLDILDIAVIRAEKHCSKRKTTGFRFLALVLLRANACIKEGESSPMVLNIDLFNTLRGKGN